MDEGKQDQKYIGEQAADVTVDVVIRGVEPAIVAIQSQHRMTTIKKSLPVGGDDSEQANESTGVRHTQDMHTNTLI